MRSAFLGCLLLACFASGCSSITKKPHTPADDIPATAFLDSTPPVGERYYMMIFGSESTPKRAKYTHTWATVVRVIDNAGGEPAIEPHTISWMPASLDIKAISRKVEPGKNLELNFTVEEMLRHDERVVVWGPYEVGYAIYHRFLVQKQFMESGQVGYQCIDAMGEAARTGNGCDCIHAVTDMDPLYDRERYPLTYYGLSGSKNVVKQIHERPIILNPAQCNDWLFARLGLDKYPVERLKWNGKTVECTTENIRAYLNSPKVRRQLAK